MIHGLTGRFFLVTPLHELTLLMSNTSFSTPGFPPFVVTESSRVSAAWAKVEGKVTRHGVVISAEERMKNRLAYAQDRVKFQLGNCVVYNEDKLIFHGASRRDMLSFIIEIDSPPNRFDTIVGYEYEYWP